MQLISIIIPAYNAEKTIERCINSILTGSYQNIEIIAVNNGSTDKTGEILERIAMADSRLKVIHCMPNRGPGGGRNLGLECCNGDFIAWCDSDDWVAPDWLQHQYHALTSQNADIAVCRARIEDGREHEPRQYESEMYDHDAAIVAFLERKNLNAVLWNKLFRASLIKDKRIPNGIYYMEDEPLMWQVLKDAQKIVRTPHDDYHFVIHPNSTLAQPINNKRIEDVLVIWSTILDECRTHFPALGQCC